MKYILISLISLLTLPVLADDDNQINITQLGGGNAVEFRIDQYGYKNIFDLDLDGQNAYIRFVQNGGNNTVNANILGNNNRIIGQQFGGDTHTININGNNNLAGTWYGTSQNNNIEINLLGNNNFGAVEARGVGGHDITLNLSNGGNAQLWIDMLTPDTFTFSQDCAVTSCGQVRMTRQ